MSQNYIHIKIQNQISLEISYAGDLLDDNKT
jgi:hypothetical protein